MNANVNNSVNANNSNINAMNANNIEFVCSRCGSSNITARPKCEELPQITEVGDRLYIKGGVTDMIINQENELSKVIAQNLGQLPEAVLNALKAVGVYDNLLDVASSIEEEGYIRNPKVVRRWLVSQTLKLVYKDGYHDMSQFLSTCGFRYALKVMENELNVMAHMEAHGDIEALEEHRRIWSDSVYVETMLFWIRELNEAGTEKYKKHHCKGRNYVKVYHPEVNGGKGVFIDEWLRFIERFSSWLKAFNDCETYRGKLEAFHHFRGECKKMRWQPSKNCKAFQNAFKAAGGYYTLKDLILFEGVKLNDDCPDQLEALNEAFNQWVGNNVTKEGYKMYGYLKKVLKDNNFDFNKTKQKWYEASVARKAARQNHERRSRN